MAFEVVLVENKLRPSSVNYVDSFPLGGSLGTRKNLKNYKEIFYAG